MNLTKSQAEGKTVPRLRKYGLLMGSAFAVLTVLFVLRGRAAWMYTAVPSVVFAVLALVAPGVLAPVEKYWMKLAAVMGFVMTNVLLTLVYIIAIIPIGLALQLLGKATVRKGFLKNSDSYWQRVDPEGPAYRPDKPY